MSAPWRIVFMGTPDPAAASLAELLRGPDPVVGVVSQPDRATGRGQRTAPSPVRRVAEGAGLTTLGPDKIRDPVFLAALQGWSPDLIVVVAYGRILPRALLELPRHGCVNVHYSLLPKYRGAAPIPWAIINGEAVSGVTTIRLVEKMDAGPVLLQEEVPLSPGETTCSLTAKMVPVGARLLSETVRGLKEGTIVAKPQKDEQASFAPMIKKEDGEIRWLDAALAIERQVRAFDPWPSAYTHWRQRLLKIHRARVLSMESSGSPGDVLRADQGGLWVATGEGVLSLEEVQLENRKKMEAREFLKGARIEKGESF